MDQGAADEEPPRTEVVVYVSHNRRSEKHEEGLQGDNPRYRRRRIWSQQLSLVKLLKHTDCYMSRLVAILFSEQAF